MKNILVTDGQYRKALTIVRALGDSNYNIYVSSSQRFCIARYSKYVKKFIHYPDYKSSEKKFLKFIKKIISIYNIKIILPIEDESVEIFSRKKELFKTVFIPIPDYDKFIVARDKAKTLIEAKSAGIDIPKTWFLENIKKIDKIKDKIEYPAVIKPKKSSGSRGIAYIKNKKDFLNKYLKVHQKYKYPMIQEYIPQNGKKYQVLLLRDKKGKIVASAVQELIRQFPVRGGPGTLFKTIKNKKLLEKSIKLLDKIDWFGIACVEFIEDTRNGRNVLMEINPRFWGTLNLSINAGVNFPKILVEGKQEQEITCKEGIYCQWLIPGDILNFAFNKNRFKQEIPYFFNKPERFHYVIYSKKDKKPFFINFLILFKNLFSYQKIKSIFTRS